MVVDPARPSTWVHYEDGLCKGCEAHCCRLPVEVTLDDLVRMEIILESERASPKKVLRQLRKAGIAHTYRDRTGYYMLDQRPNGDCLFLGADRLCIIYDKRPDTCRNFPRVGPRSGFCPAIKKKLPL